MSQNLEIIGWSILMLFSPILVIIEKISAPKIKHMKILGFIQFLFYFCIPLIITYIFYNANYSLFLSFLIGFLYYFVSILSSIFYLIWKMNISNNSYKLVFFKLEHPSFIFSFLFGFCLFLIGFYLNSYIFLISSFILLPVSIVGFIHHNFFGGEMIESRMEDSVKFSSFDKIIPIFSIFFGMNLFGIIDAVSLHWFYSTIAQVFSALFGIIIMIGVFILSASKNMNNNRTHLLNALKGYSILFSLLIIISIFCIAFIHETDEASNIKPSNVDLSFDTLLPNIPIGERQLPNPS